MAVDSLMLCTVEGLKIRGTTCGFSYQDCNRSYFCGFGSSGLNFEKALKCCRLQDFMRFYNVRTARMKRYGVHSVTTPNPIFISSSSSALRWSDNLRLLCFFLIAMGMEEGHVEMLPAPAIALAGLRHSARAVA